MAFLGIKVPDHVWGALQKVRVPGKKEHPEEYHATMFYLGKQVPIENLTHMIEVAHDVLAKAKPFSVKLDHVTNFPSGKDGFPIICPVESAGLMKLRQEMKEAFDAEGVEYANNFPQYSPHVTLSYSDSALEERLEFRPLKWKADRIVLWGGDSGEDRMVVEFPLFSTASKTAFLVALKYAQVLNIHSNRPVV